MCLFDVGRWFRVSVSCTLNSPGGVSYIDFRHSGHVGFLGIHLFRPRRQLVTCVCMVTRVCEILCILMMGKEHLYI